MAAKTKDELLAVTEKDFAKLAAALERIDAATATRKRAEDTSIKDVIAHRAHWIGLYLGWYEDGMAGKEVFFPAEGYKWNRLKAYNAELRERQASLTWEAAVEQLNEAHRTLVAFIADRTEDELYGGPMKGANNDWTAGRWAEAAGASHYRSAAKYLRQCARDGS